MAKKTYDDFLAHYGVLGMKWGVRKKRPNRVVVPSDDYKAVKSSRKKNVSELSNAELKQLTTRMNLEQQYAKLNPKKVQVGRNYVKAAIGLGASGIALYNMVHSPAGQAAIKTGKEWMYRSRAWSGYTKMITQG